MEDVPQREPTDAEMLVENIASIVHEANKAYCDSIGDRSQKHWCDAPQWQRNSMRNGVQYRLDNPKCTPQEMHENWLKVKRADGWMYGPVKDELEKTHPCCVEYDQLPPEQRRKDMLSSAIITAMVS